MPPDFQPKILAVVGPTASGKSELAVALAKKFRGEIISCDSRQIYKGMDLGTGKVPGRWIAARHPKRAERAEGSLKKIFVYKSIPHHLIDFQNPAQQYSAARFQREAKKTIADILKRGRLPILCGGTMHWIDAIVFGQAIPAVKPDFQLRARLEKQSADALYKRLIKLDPTRAASIDKFNKRRLIRALEIVIISGKPVPILQSFNLQSSNYSPLWLGITRPQADLYKKIDVRLKQRLKAGMLKEVAILHKRGLSYKRLESFGLEYKFISLFLQKKISHEEMVKQLSYAIKHYSKRQMTWWKRNKDIIWIKPEAKKAIKLTKQFLLAKS